jgi:phosphate starvation-inducible membrane PsiE
MNTQAPNLPEDHAGSHVSPPAWMSRLGLGGIGWVRLLLLTIIAALTLVATAVGLLDIARAGNVTISDVLLMFIYLEIWAMIAIETTLRQVPVNFVIYIAITVLTRHLVGVAGDKATTDIGLLVDAGAILILAIAALLMQFPVQQIYRSTSGANTSRMEVGSGKPDEKA